MSQPKFEGGPISADCNCLTGTAVKTSDGGCGCTGGITLDPVKQLPPIVIDAGGIITHSDDPVVKPLNTSLPATTTVHNFLSGLTSNPVELGIIAVVAYLILKK